MLSVSHIRIAGGPPHSFEIATGACLSVRGPSGCGKTRLLRAIADLDPHEGEAHTDTCKRNEVSAPFWRQKVRYVAAESGWWAPRVENHFTQPEISRPRFHTLALPDQLWRSPIDRLSSGERQRLSLLRALEGAPEVLLLDEPSAALDPESKEEVEKLLQEQMSHGLTLLLITHDEAQAKRLASRHLLFTSEGLKEEGS